MPVRIERYWRVALFACLLASAGAQAQITSNHQSNPVDPGIRGGPPGAGNAFATGLSSGQIVFFNRIAQPAFSEIEDVPDGLGPRFNLDSCAGCHIFPAVGGSSPPANNPQVTRLSVMAPGNRIPAFLTANGPIREVRFVSNLDGTPDGGVHSIFTITGRSDKPAGCSISQPDFSNTANLRFRIPTPVFGAGLIEAITDTTIRNNLAATAAARGSYGISGRANSSGNDGTITRFGWKAQNKSLQIFSGEAYNVEMGVTNEAFPTEREADTKCAVNRLPEDETGFDEGNSPSDLVAFAAFMRFLDQPAPACGVAGKPGCSSSVNNGRAIFSAIGCAFCHTPTLITGSSSIPALDRKPANLYSDLALHSMGTGLADGISQGGAGPSEFRTAPLWGLGQRAFFLHDGRTSDLLKAITAHDSQGSEASRVIDQFQGLTGSQKQDLLNFLRSL